MGFSWVQYEAGNDLPWRLKKIPTGSGRWDHNGCFNLRFYFNDGRYQVIAAQKTLRIEECDRCDQWDPVPGLAVRDGREVVEAIEVTDELLGEEDVRSALIGLGDLGKGELGLGQYWLAIGDVERSKRAA